MKLFLSSYLEEPKNSLKSYWESGIKKIISMVLYNKESEKKENPLLVSLSTKELPGRGPGSKPYHVGNDQSYISLHTGSGSALKSLKIGKLKCGLKCRGNET